MSLYFHVYGAPKQPFETFHSSRKYHEDKWLVCLCHLLRILVSNDLNVVVVCSSLQKGHDLGMVI